MENISTYFRQRKIAYLKNGDVVEEIQAIGDVVEDDILQNGGPYHYIGSFLKWSAGSRALVISLDVSDKRFDGKNGLIARVINTKQFQGRLAQAYLHLRAFFKIFLFLIRFRPDWILCAVAGGSPLAACYLASKILGVPLVHSRHMRVELYRPSIFQKVKSKIDAWLIRKASNVMCNGTYLRDQLIEIGVKPARIIEFRVPYKNIAATTGRSRVSAGNSDAMDKCDLFYVGRIEKNKGAWDLLNACHPILLENDKVKLTYIGDGKLLNTLKSRAVEMGLEGRVLFLGRLNHKAVIQKLQSCDILIVPTRQELGEGRPKTVIEGLITGCCLLVPDYGAFRYLIKNLVNGLMYLPDDIEDMRCKINYLVQHPGIRKNLSNNAKMMCGELIQPKKRFLQALEEATMFIWPSRINKIE